jgi:hypothetical protein
MGTSRTPDAPAPTPQRTLADDLRARDDASMAALLQARPDLARPTPSDVTQVASRATARHSVAAVIDELDTRALTALSILALLPEPGRLADVVRMLGTDEATAAASVDRLRMLALVWGPDDELHTVRAATDVVGQHPAGLGLSGSALPIRDWDPDALAERLDAQDDAARELLARLTWGPPSGTFSPGSPVLPVVQRLADAGLVAVMDETTVILPREVAMHLRDGVLSREAAAGPPPVQAATAVASDQVATGAALEAVQQVESLLERWSHDGPTILRGGGVGVRDARLAAVALGVDEARAGFLIEVAAACGLLGRLEDPRTGDRWAPTTAFDLWLGEPLAERWATLAAGWLDTERVLALVGRRDDKDRPINPLAPGLERQRTPFARRLALRVLDGLRPAAPASPDEVVARVEWERPLLGAHRDTVVRSTLTEAGWLGVTGMGALSPAGAALLADGATAAAAVLAPGVPEPLQHVLLQADLTAVAPGPLDRDVATTMGMLADVESQGGATVYRFSGASVRRALDAGWPTDRVHEFLRTHSRTPVPQPLTFLVDDTARRHGRLRLGLASMYLRSDDPTELDAVLADPQLAGLGLRRIAPTVALTDSDETLVLETLREAGHAPLAESLDGTVHRPSRTPPRAQLPRRRRGHGASASGQPAVSAEEARALVDAIRAGDEVSSRRPTGPTTRPRTGSLDALAALREAAQTSGSVWMSYMDQTGTLSERIVDPLRVDAGWLTAYDHRTDDTRRFAVHRIRQVAPA